LANCCGGASGVVCMGHGVAASPGLRASFVLLLVASVGAKFAIGNPSLRVVETTMEKSAKAEIGAFLNRQGFRVDNIQDQTDSLFVSAINGSCHLIAMAAAPQGWHRGLLQQLAQGARPTAVPLRRRRLPGPADMAYVDGSLLARAQSLCRSQPSHSAGLGDRCFPYL